MSCQTVIDQFLSEEGKFQRTITVVGESGPASVPTRCAVTFIECNITSLSVAAHSTVVLCNCKISGKVTQIDGTFTADRTEFSDEVSFTNVKATEKTCKHSESVYLYEGSVLEASGTLRVASLGHYGVLADTGSRALLLNETNTGYLNAAVGSMHASSVIIRNCTLEGIEYGILVTEGARVEMVGGKLEGVDLAAIKALRGGEASLTGITGGIHGHTYALQAEESSKIRVTNTDIVRSKEVGILSYKYSTVEVSQFNTVLGAGSTGIKSEENSSVYIDKGKSVQSDGAEALRLSGESTIHVTNVQTVLSSPNTAIISDSGSTVLCRNISGRIIGLGGLAIQAGSGDTYTIENVPQVRGVAGHGVTSGSGCSFSFVNVEEIQGLAGHGMVLGSSNVLNCRNVDLIKGNTGTGIIAGSDLKATFLNVKSIFGEDADGLVAGSRCILRAENLEEIRGVEGRGVVVGSNSDLEFTNFGTIVGWMGDAIEAPSSRVVARKGQRIDAPTTGEGVQVDGSGGVIFLSGIERINAEEGDGVRISAGQLTVQRCGRIGGGGAGINLQEGSNASIHTLDRLFGGDVGLKIEGGSQATASSVESWEGGGEGGIGSKESVVTAQSIGVLIGAPMAVKSEEGSSVSVHSAGVVGDVFADGESSVKLENCEVTGGALINASVLDCSRVTFTKGVTLTESALNYLRGEVGEAITATDSAVSCHLVAIAGVVGLVASGGVFTKCSSMPPVLTEGGGLAAGCDMGEPVVVEASFIHAAAAEALVRSELLVRIQADQILEVTT